MSSAHLGAMNEASHHAQQVMRIHPNFSLEHWRNKPPNKDPHENEIFIEGCARRACARTALAPPSDQPRRAADRLSPNRRVAGGRWRRSAARWLH